MAYLDLEFRNARMVWETWGDRITAIGIIVCGLAVATVVATYMVPGSIEFIPQP